MAAKPAAQRVSKISAKQLAADRGNLVKARKTLKGRPRTEKQLAASRRNIAKARQATHARSQGKTYVTKKAAKAPAPDTWTFAVQGQRNLDLPGLVPSETGVPLDLHALPVCGPVAVAGHLAAFTGAWVPDENVLELWNIVQDATMADLLEYLRAEGFPGSGEKLAHFEQCDTDAPVPGLVYGLELPQGYHAVLAHPDGDRGAISWGLLVPWCALLHDGAAPAEAWWLEWETE